MSLAATSTATLRDALRPLVFERSGRFSREKAGALVLALLPAVWLAVLAWQGPPSAAPVALGPGAGGGLAGPGFAGPAFAAEGLGSRPVSAAIHFTGLWALRFLWLSLLVTPVQRLFDWPKLFFTRRILGLAALAYATLHLGLFVVDQGVAKATQEIVLRVYLVIGATALAVLLALGATSFNRAIRAMGQMRWKRLHRLVYPAAVLGVVHFFFQSKLDVTEPTLMAGALIWLFGCRLLLSLVKRPGALALAGLAGASAVLTALAEMAWYGLMTRVDPWRVGEANFSFVLGPRPAWWVLAGGLAFAAAVALHRAREQGRRAAVQR